MNDTQPSENSLALDILNQLEALLIDAESTGKPIELTPYREQLFELFVTADGAGYTDDEADPDLTADGICRDLAERWDLRDATIDSFVKQEKLTEKSLARMRLLWSVMRMWMEWTYAWRRWEEFHTPTEE